MASHGQISAKSNWLYRLFGRGPSRVSLDDETMHIEGIFGDVPLRIPGDAIESITVRPARFRHRLTVRLKDGAKGSIGGLGEREALRIRDAVLQNWDAELVEAVLGTEAMNLRLRRLGEELRQLSAGERYTRYSASIELHKAVVSTLRECTASIRKHLDPDTREVFERLESVKEPGRLEDVRREGNRLFVSGSVRRVKDTTRPALSNSLTDEQAEAVATDEDVTLVLAGAGTGKTSVIVGKVAHLIYNEGVSPDKILVLAFNIDAAAEIRKRLDGELSGADVRTFHSFGGYAINKSRRDYREISKLAKDERVLRKTLRKIVRKVRSNPKQLQAAIDFIHHGKPRKPVSNITEKQEGWLAELLATFLDHFKGSRVSIDELRSRARISNDPERNGAFLNVFEYVRERYERLLMDSDERDFHDLINEAADDIRDDRWKPKYRYVLVDEFQDISAGRMALLETLRRPGRAFFLVGDDWQSIYRFAGSDVRLMRNCDDHLGHVEERTLSNTFRFADSILEPSSSFIKKNPEQTQRTLLSASSAPDAGITIVPTKGDWPMGVKRALEDIKKAARGEQRSVLVLGRYNKSVDMVRDTLPKEWAEQVECTTVHRAKGREADYAIVLDLNNRGFPSTTEDDPVLELVLPPVSGSAYPFAEERRLFYVAMTRAKTGTYLITTSSKSQSSRFVRELLDEPGNERHIKVMASE